MCPSRPASIGRTAVAAPGLEHRVEVAEFRGVASPDAGRDTWHLPLREEQDRETLRGAQEAARTNQTAAEIARLQTLLQSADTTAADPPI